MMTLTGNKRYRVGFRGVLILQVEYSYVETDYSGGYVHNFNGKNWRDATIEDITEGVIIT